MKMKNGHELTSQFYKDELIDNFHVQFTMEIEKKDSSDRFLGFQQNSLLRLQ